MMPRRAVLALALALWAMLVLGLWAMVAEAHKASDSYLFLTVDGSAIEGRWDIALRDLEQAIGLDRDGDGTVTWGELRARLGAIADYALARLQLLMGLVAIVGRRLGASIPQ